MTDMQETRYNLLDADSVALLSARLVGRKIAEVLQPSMSPDDWYDFALRLEDGSMLKIEAQGIESDGVEPRIEPAK